MRAVIQRVTQASCRVDDQITGAIDDGLLVLIGMEDADTTEDLEWLSQKISAIRIFSDENGLMNKSLADIDGNILLISQFTLFAATKKGNRPGFTRAAKPEKAVPLYELMISKLSELIKKEIQTGVFGADMHISLINSGPVTIFIDSKNRE